MIALALPPGAESVGPNGFIKYEPADTPGKPVGLSVDPPPPGMEPAGPVVCLAVGGSFNLWARAYRPVAPPPPAPTRAIHPLALAMMETERAYRSTNRATDRAAASAAHRRWGAAGYPIWAEP